MEDHERAKQEKQPNAIKNSKKRGSREMDFIVKNALENNNNEIEQSIGKANIKVIGVGGAGNNMVNWLSKKGIAGAEIIAVNTDAQHLSITNADKKYIIGRDLTRGLGCGGFPNTGAEAANESMQQLKDSPKGA